MDPMQPKSDGGPLPERPSSGAEPRTPSVESGQAAVLYLRGSPVNREHENEIIRELNTLAADGYLDDVVVKTWPEKVSYQHDRGMRSVVIDEFESFVEWARDHDVSICPPFSRREHTSSITNEHDELLHTPMMFLSVVDQDGIVGLYPCRHGDDVTSIEDWLARFDRVDRDEPRRVASGRAEAPSGTSEGGGG